MQKNRFLKIQLRSAYPDSRKCFEEGAVDRIMEESRIGREAKLIEELMKEISINGKVSYGRQMSGTPRALAPSILF